MLLAISASEASGNCLISLCRETSASPVLPAWAWRLASLYRLVGARLWFG